MLSVPVPSSFTFVNGLVVGLVMRNNLVKALAALGKLVAQYEKDVAIVGADVKTWLEDVKADILKKL